VAEIAMEGLSKTYEDGTRAVSNLDLELADGEVLVLVGPSGCGKSTALKMVAGLEEITSGTLRIGSRVVNGLEPGERDVAMVFQNYALYPHMSIADNLGFSLKLRKVAKEERGRRVREVAQILAIDELLDKKPRHLSGGQRQRVAMGRAIIRHPQAFLMDEPLSNLDAKLRLQTRTQIARLQRDLGVTMIYVTHDQTEALTLGDRVAVMSRGVVRQVAAPEELYETPDDLFVASFIGSPPMNMIKAALKRADGGALEARFGSTQLTLSSAVIASHRGLESYVDGEVILGVRPEDLTDQGLDAPASDGLRMGATIELRESLGSDVYVHFVLDAEPVVTDEIREIAADVSAEALGELERRAAQRTTTFVARLEPRSRAREGDGIELAINPRGLHFFDPETGRRIAGDHA
jgi:multiple sugar transport system ATP-binding protein